MVLATMPTCQLLQSQHNVFDKPEVGLATETEELHVLIRGINWDYEVAPTALVDVIDKAAARVPLGRNGKKERVCYIGEVAAVGKKGIYLTTFVINTGIGTCQHFCYF